MDIENECRDARDHFELEKCAKPTNSLLHGDVSGHTSTDLQALAIGMSDDVDGPDSSDDKAQAEDDLFEPDIVNANVNDAILAAQRVGLLDNIPGFLAPPHGKSSQVAGADFAEIWMHGDLMTVHRKRKCPTCNRLEPDNVQCPFRRQRVDLPPHVSFDTLGEQVNIEYVNNFDRDPHISGSTHLNNVMNDMGITGNEEQERALSIVCQHSISESPKQLLLYIAGVGGAGKSHIIKAIVEFFRRTGHDERACCSVPPQDARRFSLKGIQFMP
ncbi:hypothetical protein SERLA73DRAFT_68301 [Serpula lacrymans var. lacrymans S7.3]|uniref:DNA helicase n=2 Tax=Serpula lacrymans var. lacrymans TaxID=341189 RepID=F8PI36_SERL3|nr:hypothetical protein SERLA73DRAFT_68301 [Serpula lacrymans var. lacrymans S7.3]